MATGCSCAEVSIGGDVLGSWTLHLLPGSCPRFPLLGPIPLLSVNCSYRCKWRCELGSVCLYDSKIASDILILGTFPGDHTKQKNENNQSLSNGKAAVSAANGCKDEISKLLHLSL